MEHLYAVHLRAKVQRIIHPIVPFYRIQKSIHCTLGKSCISKP